MTTIDNTNGQTPNENQEFLLTVENKNGERHGFYGNSKKEANKNLISKYPYQTKNIISKEWEIEAK